MTVSIIIPDVERGDEPLTWREPVPGGRRIIRLAYRLWLAIG